MNGRWSRILLVTGIGRERYCNCEGTTINTRSKGNQELHFYSQIYTCEISRVLLYLGIENVDFDSRCSWNVESYNRVEL